MRSNTEAYSLTNITVDVVVGSTVEAGAMVKIDPVYQIFHKEVKNVWLKRESGVEAVNVGFNNTYDLSGSEVDYITISLPAMTETSFTLIIKVVNSPLVPVKGSILDITIYNNTLIYYKNTQIKIQN